MTWTKQIHDWLGDGGSPDYSYSNRHASEFIYSGGGGGGGTPNDPGVSRFFHPSSPLPGSGVLSNFDRTILSVGESSGAVIARAFTDPEAAANPFVAEFIIDARVDPQRINVNSDFNPIMFWESLRNDASYGNLFLGGEFYVPSWATGDRLGLILYQGGAAFFRNGVVEAVGPTSAHSVDVQVYGAGGQITVECDINNMLYQEQYQAFMVPTPGSWPA